MRICKSLSPKLEMQQKRRLITSTIDTNHAEILGCVLLILMDIFRKTEKAIGFFWLFFNVGFQTVLSFQSQKNLRMRTVHTTKTAL
jgi:hypothetical protein